MRHREGAAARLRVGAAARLRVGAAARLRVGAAARLRVGAAARLRKGAAARRHPQAAAGRAAGRKDAWRRVRADAGRVSIFMAVAVVGLLFIIGVAVDAAGVLRTRARAENIAAEAARAAGQGIDLELAATTGEQRVDPDRALDYADQYLGHTLPTLNQPYTYAAPSPVNGGAAVQIEVTLYYEPQILGLFGQGQIEVTTTATAVLCTSPDSCG